MAYGYRPKYYICSISVIIFIIIKLFQPLIAVCVYHVYEYIFYIVLVSKLITYEYMH